MHSPIRQDSPVLYDEAAIAASNLEMIDKQQRSNSPLDVPLQTNLYKKVYTKWRPFWLNYRN